MKKIVFCLLLLTFSFRLAAQIDYLEPVKPFSSYTGELGEYYRSVFSLLNTGFQKQPYARFAAIPSFSPEYAMSVERKNGRYTLISNTLSRTYWQAEKGTVTVDTKSVVISASLYQSLGAIFRLVTEQVQDLDGSTAGLDGIVYYFSSTDAKGKERMGRKWSPEKGTLMERLVLVCQSAYMLSRGENILEQTLAEEAASLLKALQQRSKEEPDAYKQPMYVGIYPVGPRAKTLSGRQVEEPAHFSAMSPEEYIANEMVYPAGLLEKNVSGYALCEFTIDKEGVILRPHILRSTHPEFAEEALRIVKGMPKWSPALAGGKPADSNYTLYIPFRPQLYRAVNRRGQQLFETLQGIEEAGKLRRPHFDSLPVHVQFIAFGRERFVRDETDARRGHLVGDRDGIRPAGNRRQPCGESDHGALRPLVGATVARNGPIGHPIGSPTGFEMIGIGHDRDLRIVRTAGTKRYSGGHSQK